MMDAMKLHHRRRLVYNLDETGLQLAWSYNNQKLLAVEGSKEFVLLFTEKKGKP
jgi:hypothetical protein